MNNTDIEIPAESPFANRGREREERMEKYLHEVNNPDWQNNDKLYIKVRKAIESYFPYQLGWYSASDEEWQEGIRTCLERLISCGYKIISRDDFELNIKIGVKGDDDKWLNTIHTNGRADMRLVIDTMEALVPTGFLIAGKIETLTILEVGLMFSQIFSAMRVANLGLIKDLETKRPS